MAMTPVEISSVEFSKSFRGYNVEEVDEFFQEVYKDYEFLYRENQEQKEKIEELRESLEKYEEIEKTLNDTLVLAQKTAEEAKNNSEKEAELIIKEAQDKADQLIKEARQEVKKEQEKLEEIKRKQQVFVAECKSRLLSQLELLENSMYDKTLNIEEDSDSQEENNTDSDNIEQVG